MRQQTPASAQLIAQTYFGSLDRDGAKQVARRFAADILQQFGVPSLLGSRVFFASDRTGPKSLPGGTRVPVKEIWSMDYDGTDQRQLTRLDSDSMPPAVSPSGDMFAFTTYPAEVSARVPHDGKPQIAVFSSRTGRRLTFLNPSSSLVTTPGIRARRQAPVLRSSF
jgi:TolB protein